MDRYISRNRLASHMSDVCKWCRDTVAEFDGLQPDCEQCPLHRLKEKLKQVPDADVRPVARSEWKDLSYIKGDKYYLCFACGQLEKRPFPSNFCPNCGAVMREADNG